MEQLDKLYDDVLAEHHNTRHTPVIEVKGNTSLNAEIDKLLGKMRTLYAGFKPQKDAENSKDNDRIANFRGACWCGMLSLEDLISSLEATYLHHRVACVRGALAGRNAAISWIDPARAVEDVI